MKFKYKIKELEIFRKEIIKSQKKENFDIKKLLNWRKKKLKKTKIKSKLINVKQIKNWHTDSRGNIRHKSGQFFSVEGVRTEGAFSREVSSWDQPIFNQKHGGILAMLARKTNQYGIEFLLDGKSEPGDEGDIKFAPSFQATQSNINRAHGGKKTPLSDLVIKQKGAKLICAASHNEEGARFWKKPNQNLILLLNDPHNPETKKDNFIWASLTQIKKLCLIDNIVNPYVKTILFMI